MNKILIFILIFISNNIYCQVIVEDSAHLSEMSRIIDIYYSKFDLDKNKPLEIFSTADSLTRNRIYYIMRSKSLPNIIPDEYFKLGKTYILHYKIGEKLTTDSVLKKKYITLELIEYFKENSDNEDSIHYSDPKILTLILKPEGKIEWSYYKGNELNMIYYLLSQDSARRLSWYEMNNIKPRKLK